MLVTSTDSRGEYVRIGLALAPFNVDEESSGIIEMTDIVQRILILLHT